MNIISVDKLTKTGREKNLFTDITFGLDFGEKAALIGKNGCGKSTLLKIIAGYAEADGGNVCINNTADISYLAQSSVFNEDDLIREYIFRNGNAKARLINEYEKACEILSLKKDSISENNFHKLSLQMDNENAWNYEQEIKSILNILGIDDLNLRMGSLSGGMLKKVEIAHVLIEDRQLLLLDEPTNHLDISTIKWLEDYLVKTKKTVLMVTHDRYFLDNICSSIYELDNGKLNLYKGNFTYYLEKKEAESSSLVRNEEKLDSILRKEMEWLRRGPKARGTKAKARKDAIYKLIDREKVEDSAEYSFETTGRRLGSKILEITSISKSYSGSKIISDFSYVFKKGERIGLFGRNGSGKTTLLELFTGSNTPDCGSIVKGDNTCFGYYKQNPDITNEEITVLEYIKESAEFIKLKDGTELSASKLLERFGFEGKIQYSSLQNLSGGEKKRVYLVKLLMSNPNFLILDEPTNDLDIYTLSVLEDFLSGFAGCLIIVSHDRYFMDKIADTLFVIEDNGEITGFAGNCSEYLDYKSECEEDLLKEKNKKEQKTVKEKNDAPAVEKKKLTYKESKELEGIEALIESLEEEKSELEVYLSSGESDHLKLKEWSLKFDEVEKSLSEKYARWEELYKYK